MEETEGTFANTRSKQFTVSRHQQMHMRRICRGFSLRQHFTSDNVQSHHSSDIKYLLQRPVEGTPLFHIHGKKHNVAQWSPHDFLLPSWLRNWRICKLNEYDCVKAVKILICIIYFTVCWCWGNRSKEGTCSILDDPVLMQSSTESFLIPEDWSMKICLDQYYPR